jgi:hypothetical protein
MPSSRLLHRTTLSPTSLSPSAIASILATLTTPSGQLQTRLVCRVYCGATVICRLPSTNLKSKTGISSDIPGVKSPNPPVDLQSRAFLQFSTGPAHLPTPAKPAPRCVACVKSVLGLDLVDLIRRVVEIVGISWSRARWRLILQQSSEFRAQRS